jgi:exodeoxyribonuclease V alpha subunit
MNEIIQGTLTSISRRFDNGYIIASIDPGGHKMVGTLPNPVLGDRMEFHGHWEEHPRYGKQFNFDLAITVMPKTNQDMLGFLSQLKHIGPVRANAIMKKFGDSIFEVLDNNPQQITAISGITAERVKIIAGEWDRLKSDKDTIFFLNSLGCTPRQRALIMEHYKEETIATVKVNPYRMIKDIKGFGFKVVDGFAKKLGIANDSPLRAEAAVEHILRTATETKQHTYLPEEKIIESGTGEFRIPGKRLAETLIKLHERNIIEYKAGRWCALKYFYDWEVDIADRLQQLLTHKAEADSRFKICDTFIDPVTGQTVVLNERQL